MQIVLFFGLLVLLSVQLHHAQMAIDSTQACTILDTQYRP